MYFMEKFLSTGEVAKRLNKSREMIYKYIKQGKLKPDACSGNEILFREQTVLDFENNAKAKKA
jgi:excisionase family DNA binding protein